MRRRNDESATPNHRIPLVRSPTPLPLPPHQRLLSDGARNGAEIPALSEAGDPRIRAAVRPAVEDQEAVL